MGAKWSWSTDDIHKPQIGDKNWHAHILLTMRR
ncbi:putative conjugative transfer TraA domain protein, partial [Orientia tsutsugamushi str. TA716]